MHSRRGGSSVRKCVPDAEVRRSGERLLPAGCLRRPAEGLSERSVERYAQRGTRDGCAPPNRRKRALLERSVGFRSGIAEPFRGRASPHPKALRVSATIRRGRKLNAPPCLKSRHKIQRRNSTCIFDLLYSLLSVLHITALPNSARFVTFRCHVSGIPQNLL